MRPLVIAHRGASGYRPEHTLAAYRLAIRQGADYIEPDLVATRDGVLVARHENEISATTDIVDHPEFSRRRGARTVDGVVVEGWFTEDFTLAELRTLRARERLPDLRPTNTRWDDRWSIPTFDEVLMLAAHASRHVGRPVGVYPETKHPTHFRSLGLPLEEPLLAALARHPGVPVFVQSFEASSLRLVRERTQVPLVQLRGAGDDVDTAEIARYADAVGVHKDLVIPRLPSGHLGQPSPLVSDAHAVGLKVHAWTFRAERPYVPQGVDVAAELEAFAAAGVDAVFTDQPDLAVATFSRLDGS